MLLQPLVLLVLLLLESLQLHSRRWLHNHRKRWLLHSRRRKSLSRSHRRKLHSHRMLA